MNLTTLLAIVIGFIGLLAALVAVINGFQEALGRIKKHWKAASGILAALVVVTVAIVATGLGNARVIGPNEPPPSPSDALATQTHPPTASNGSTRIARAATATPAPRPTATFTPTPTPSPTPTFTPSPTPTFTPNPLYNEYTPAADHTWTNYTNAGGTQGQSVGANQWVQVSCALTGFKVADGNTWWYRLASSPWNNQYYASADGFCNNGQACANVAQGPFVDPSVPHC